MSELQQLQKTMMDWLLEHDTSIRSHVSGTKKVDKDTRLNIYGNAYRYRLIDALSDNYPALHTLLGDDEFYKMSDAYLTEHPSSHFSIRYFGNQLTRYLQHTHNDQPILAEMAAFEWALRTAFDATDQQPIDRQALQNVPPVQWSTLSFTLHPSVSLVTLTWNTPQLWAAIEAQSEQIPAEKLEQSLTWLVWRKELQPYYRSLAPDEHHAIKAALQGQNFTQISEAVSESTSNEHAPARVAELVSTWIQDGLIINLN